MTKNHIDCDHLVGYLGMDETNATLAHTSDGYTFEDLVAEGMKFDFCPHCGTPIKWKDPEAE